jgi:hypothetical protein
MLLYRGVVVGSSELYTALREKKMETARAIFDDTTLRYEQTYPKEDREWFDKKSQEGWPMDLMRKKKEQDMDAIIDLVARFLKQKTKGKK